MFTHKSWEERGELKSLLSTFLSTGFVQSLEFLNKYGNLQTSCLGMKKVCKIEIKSGKNRKKSGIFFHPITSTLLLSEMLASKSNFM